MTAPDIRIGTSGWVYKHWRNVFYPHGVPQSRWLAFYAEHFDTVEVNFSFYRLPAKQTFASWRQRAAPGFRYAVKGSRYITHLKRLLEPEEHVNRFFERVAGLGDRSGPILWQLPPDLHRDDERLRRFLAALPAEYRSTVEFRHESWHVEPVYELLAEHRVALSIPDHPRYPQALRLTAGWTYIRFHYGGSPDGDYTPAELDRWADRIRAFRDQGAEVWAYFNNDWLPAQGQPDPRPLALQDALSLRGRLTSTL